MTAQVADRVRWSGTDWSLVGVNGRGLFDPTAFGIHPRATSTANWRGFVCHYVVRDRRLELHDLDIGLEKNDAERAKIGAGPEIGGVSPSPPESFGGFTYRNVKLPIPFDGHLLLGDRFLRELYVHMGFHPAWKYERIVELGFEDGLLVRDVDLSADYAVLREQLASEPLRPPFGASMERLRRWIESTFDQSYGMSRTQDGD